ncbi:hypothetical protein LEP1GSC151_2765 [Leptospira interrogans serovar Grippotyphosa str. LT2186]|uniref:Uncharacterized protein n=1 Tax=Leptospira interrogans serovar Grippotyphosa str. LT2186 TaxID=1001599 RepID=M3GZI5_LEPIR|nr:hypothetical protein [Leptospira interrogans]EKR46072.1 hypothetical protein LEP1GSC097_0976 [Leptospira interrogans serovar Grippotyphosa str. UI 08368]EMG12123.1 hypothetical protein LEP1GSC151_2765 [Leptospira interrogans serovar Grippotyphosa str. LT2186]
MNEQEQISINLNDFVKVKLNEAGFKRLTEDYNSLMPSSVCRVSIWHFQKQVDADGYSMFQIHEFMRIFSPDLHLVDMNVLIVRRKEL